MKKKIIAAIKAIIEEYGSFTCADVHAGYSPVVGSLGKDAVQLAESFYHDKVETFIYIHDIENSTIDLAYEALSLNVLKQIHKLAIEFKEMNEE